MTNKRVVLPEKKTDFMGTRVWRYLLSTSFFGAVLVILISYGYHNAHQLGLLLRFSTSSLVLLLFFILASIFISGLINYVFYRNFDIDLSFKEGIGLALINSLGNQLPFVGGMIAKGVYLKKKCEVSYTLYFPATLALYVCYIAISGISGFMGLAYLTVIKTKLFSVPLFVGFACMAGSILVLKFSFRRYLVPKKWKEHAEAAADAWEKLGRNHTLVVKIFCLQFAGIIAMAARFLVVLRMLSQEVGLEHCIIFSSASTLTRIVSLVPGGIGIREGIVAGMSSYFGFEFGVSALAVALDRFVALSVVIIMSILYTRVLLKGLRHYHSIP